MSSVTPLKRVAVVNPDSLPNDCPDDFEFPYADLSAVNLVAGTTAPQRVRFAEAPTRARRRVAVGDSVIPYLVGRDWLHTRPLFVTEEHSETVFSTGFYCVRPDRRAIHPRYLNYALSTSSNLAALAQAARGVTMVGYSESDLGDLRIRIPDIRTQRAVADYLDTETARIDALIAKKQRLHDVLLERSQVSFDAMTATAPRRVPLKRITDFREGPGILAEDFREVGVPLLRITGLRDGEMTSEGCNYLDPEAVHRRWSHLRVRSGDLVISASASMGIAGFVTDDADGAVPYTGLIRFRQELSNVDLRYVRFFLESRDFMNQIDVMKTGAAIQHFGPTHLSQVSIPLFDPARQDAVVRGLERLHATTSAATDFLNHQIELLRERRQALITATVTGELEVPGVAA